MTPKFSIIIAIILLLRPPDINGQTDDAVYSEVAKIRQKQIDTIIRFTLPPNYIPVPINLPGIGTVTVYSTEFLFYFEKGTVISRKIVQGCNEDCTETINSISKPLEETEYTVFEFLRRSYQNIKNETIYPYILKLVDTIQKKEWYQELTGSHAPIYHITIYATNDEFTKSINAHDLMLTRRIELPINLNYEYNNKTDLSSFFKILKHIVDKQDEHYRF